VNDHLDQRAKQPTNKFVVPLTKRWRVLLSLRVRGTVKKVYISKRKIGRFWVGKDYALLAFLPCLAKE